MRSTKKLKWMLGLLLSIGVVGASGCKLAQQEETNQKEDTAIGILITTDEKELNQYYQNHKSEVEKQNPDGDIYEERIYLESNISTEVNEDGEKEEEWTCQFPDLDCLYYFETYVQGKKNGGTYTKSAAYGEGLSQIETATKENENKEIIKSSLEATIYFNPKKIGEGQSFSIHKIYQTEDKQVYIDCNVSKSYQIDAGEVSFGDTETCKKTENGETKILYEYSYVLHFDTETETKELCILQMNQENEVIKKNIFTAENLPEKIKPEKETAYLIVENRNEDEMSDRQVERRLYSYKEDDEDAEVFAFSGRKDGVLEEKGIEIDWGEK